MTIYYSVKPSLRVGISHWDGVIDDEVLIRNIEIILKDPDWDSSYHHVMDFSRCDFSQVTGDGMLKLFATRKRLVGIMSNHGRKIIVITSDIRSKQLANLYAILSNNTSGDIIILDSFDKVFSTLEGG